MKSMFPVLFSILDQVRKVKLENGTVLVAIKEIAVLLVPGTKFNVPYNHARRRLLRWDGKDLRASFVKSKARLETDKRLKVFEGVTLDTAFQYIMLHESDLAAKIRAELSAYLAMSLGSSLFPEALVAELDAPEGEVVDEAEVDEIDADDDMDEVDEADFGDDEDEAEEENLLDGLQG
jgi:hypothetical protein